MEQSASSSAAIADAMNMLKSGSVDETIIILKAISADTPNDPQVYTCLGVAYTQKGDKQNAIRSFKKSLALQENPKAHYNLGLAYESAGMKDDAAQSYRSAVLLNPTYTLALQAIERLASTIITPTPTAEEQTIIAQAPISPDPTIMGEPPPVVPEPAVIGHVPDFGSTFANPGAPPDFAREEAERAQ
ncbi:MAG: tetratricopeptide repeat protein [Armatimonadetes bacterium]|nr:tetratricopeptide repeat protein [Armatimonadota bacterium]